jgi:hypothetical protein
VATPREVRLLMEECEVVNRDEQRGRARRDGERGGMNDLDVAGRPLDGGSPESVPRLVEDHPGQRQ